MIWYKNLSIQFKNALLLELMYVSDGSINAAFMEILEQHTLQHDLSNRTLVMEL